MTDHKLEPDMHSHLGGERRSKVDDDNLQMPVDVLCYICRPVSSQQHFVFFIYLNLCYVIVSIESLLICIIMTHHPEHNIKHTLLGLAPVVFNKKSFFK